MKPVQNCTGFIFCTFYAIIQFLINLESYDNQNADKGNTKWLWFCFIISWTTMEVYFTPTECKIYSLCATRLDIMLSITSIFFTVARDFRIFLTKIVFCILSYVIGKRYFLSGVLNIWDPWLNNKSYLRCCWSSDCVIPMVSMISVVCPDFVMWFSVSILNRKTSAQFENQTSNVCKA